jgi:hypothetical protein
MLVDLQLFREACPTIDLSYFFYTSTTHDFRRKHLEQLLDYYASSFLQCCKVLGVKPLPGFSPSELKRRFHLSKPFGLMSGIMLLPLMLQKPEDAQDLDKAPVTADGREEEKFGELMKSVAISKTDENRGLQDRYVGLASELYEDGIL